MSGDSRDSRIAGMDLTSERAHTPRGREPLHRAILIEVRVRDGREQIVQEYKQLAWAERGLARYRAQETAEFRFALREWKWKTKEERAKLEAGLCPGEPDVPETKKCPRCRRELPIAGFRSIRGGLRMYCLDCRRQYVEENRWRTMAQTLLARTCGVGDVTPELLEQAFSEPEDCYLCGLPISRATFSVDHVIPVARGGTSHMQNLKAAHGRCNYIKGQLDFDELVDLLERMLGALRRRQG